MSKGLRFFGTDYNSSAFGGTIGASSATTNAAFSFDGLIETRWISSGENTDGNQVYLEMDYGVNRTVDAFYIYNTNISDAVVEYWSGAAWVTVSASIATITKSSDYKYIFAKLAASITTQKVRIIGEDTITPNQEKTVTLFYAFMQLGQFEYFPEFKPKPTPFQNKFKTTTGKGFLIERGEQFTASINFKSHVNQNDITLAETLLERKEPFYIWPNGGDESIFTYKFAPYRFKDIYKVAVSGPNSPEYTKNYYKSGYNNKISIEEMT